MHVVGPRDRRDHDRARGFVHLARRAGEFDHPKMIETIELVQENCLKHSVAPGIHLRALALAKFWKERGMKFLSCGRTPAS